MEKTFLNCCDEQGNKWETIVPKLLNSPNKSIHRVFLLSDMVVAGEKYLATKLKVSKYFTLCTVISFY